MRDQTEWNLLIWNVKSRIQEMQNKINQKKIQTQLKTKSKTKPKPKTKYEEYMQQQSALLEQKAFKTPENIKERSKQLRQKMERPNEKNT